MTTTSKLPFTGSEFARSGDLVDIWAGADGFEELEGSRCLGDCSTVEGFRGDDKRDFWDSGNLMAAGKEKRWDGGCCKSGGRGETSIEVISTLLAVPEESNSIVLLPEVDFLMPLPPDFRRGEHAARSTHITEGSLTGTMCSSTRNTRDTSNSTTWKIAKVNLTSSVPVWYLKADLAHQCPMIQQRSDDQLSRSQRMVVSCFLPFQRVLSCVTVSDDLALINL